MTNKTNSNVITLTTFGDFCKAYHAGTDALTCTVSSMTEFGVENAKNYVDFARRLCNAVGAMMDLRQSQGIKVDTDQLNGAESIVKDLSDNWFKSVGTREPKTKGGAKRPCYGTRYADFAIMGEILAQAMAYANNDVVKVGDKFFELMVINTARILKGEKLGRVTESEFKKAKAAANKARATKAAETAKKNKEETAQKEKEEQEKEKEMQETALKLESLEVSLTAQMAAIEKAIAMITESHATEEEKAAIIAVLNPSK